MENKLTDNILNSSQIKTLIKDKNNMPILIEVDRKRYLFGFNDEITPAPWLDDYEFIETKEFYDGVAEVIVLNGNTAGTALFINANCNLFFNDIQYLPSINLSKEELENQKNKRLIAFAEFVRDIYKTPTKFYSIVTALAVLDENAARFTLSAVYASEMEHAYKAKQLAIKNNNTGSEDKILLKYLAENLFFEMSNLARVNYLNNENRIKNALLLKDSGFYLSDMMYQLNHLGLEKIDMSNPENASGILLTVIQNIPELNGVLEKLDEHSKILDSTQKNLKSKSKTKLEKNEDYVKNLISSLDQTLSVIKEQKNLLKSSGENMNILPEKYNSFLLYLKAFISGLLAELEASKIKTEKFKEKATKVLDEILSAKQYI